MNDELDDGVMGSEEGFDEFAQKASLGDMVRHSPLAKIVIVVVVIALMGVVMMFFGSGGLEDQRSVIPSGSKVTSVPGATEEVSPAYTAAVEQKNEEDLERAIMEGGSSIPVPTETTDVRLSVPEVEENVEDPLHRWRMIQEERVERQMRAKEAEVEPITVLNAEKQNEAIESLSESMGEQMSAVLGKVTVNNMFKSKTLISYDDNSGTNSDGPYSTGAGDSNSPINSFEEEEEEEEVIISAGEIVYGQMLLEANSDIPSVVLATMVSGPLKGWKLLGSFGLEESIKMLTVKFNAAVNEDGMQYRISAVMLDPDTTLAAMRSKVNNRYIRRIVLPAAATFITGFADAMAESGRTSISVAGSSGGAITSEEPKTDKQQVATGVADAVADIGDELDEIGDVPIQVIIEAGTPIGIFFTKTVLASQGTVGGRGGGGI